MDIWTKDKRSKVMANIRSKNTKPEIILRSLLHKHGLRFRIHRKDLPGKPDIVFPSKRIAIYVHGCFWHFHNACRDGTMPKSNIEFWEKKLTANKERDKTHLKNLKKLNWKVLVIWECEIEKKPDLVLKKILKQLKPI